MSMTIREITDIVSNNTGETKRKTQSIVTEIFGVIGEALRSGDEVTIRNFGRFYPKTRNARMGRNPKTGESVSIPEKTVYKFVPRGSMKQ